MIKIENLEVWGFRGAIRGMRNPMNSWDKIDTTFDEHGNVIKLGSNDGSLMLRLKVSGPDHRKYLRMIHIQCDVTAPLYWWKDYDTYKVSTVANSCSTMHKIHACELNQTMFSTEDLDEIGLNVLQTTIDYMNYYRDIYIASGLTDKTAWRRMIQMLPSSYNQKRTIDINYETLLNIFGARSNHKLYEFRDFCSFLKKELPYIAALFEGEVPYDGPEKDYGEDI